MSPIGMSPTNTGSIGNFQLNCSLKVNNIIPVHYYKSNSTGMSVIIAEVDGPVVDGYFCLATETHDHDGLPHTLEHLIFLGSEDYPFKGVLDLLANRCLASGTNAWTDTDHTCYTMTTAGSEGFLSLMPIYIEHILYPTLTESGCITEVYHVNKEGQDAGVVYSEMQGIENTGEVLVNHCVLEHIYPGNCGYKSVSGGKMKNFRESTTIEKIRNFHKKFYRSDNLYIIVIGNIKPERVLQALQPVESKILSKGDRGYFERPWQNPCVPIMESAEITVPYPCDEEINGMVYVAWRGPSAVYDLYGLTACSILLKYLTDTSIAPLPKEFVEIPDPFAGKVTYYLIENSESVVLIQFENVPTEKLDQIYDKLKSLLLNIVTSKDEFDMERMLTVINRHRLECLTHLENSPHDSIACMLIGHMLYGNTIENLNQRLNIHLDLEKMAKEPVEFWLDLLQNYFISAKSITVKGKPSIAEQQRLAKEEQDRVASRVQELGDVGLKIKGETVAEAEKNNCIPPPDEMLTCVPIPEINTIDFYSIHSYTSFSEKQNSLFDMSKVPIYMQLNHLQTNFVYFFMLMDTSSLDYELRKYLPLFSECLLESPIDRNGVLIPYEDVVAELERDTIIAGTRLGLESATSFRCGPFSNTLSFMLQVEPKKYEIGINWIREILYQTKFTDDRIKVIATKMIYSVAEIKRQGSDIVQDLMKSIVYKKDSNHYVSSVLRQFTFLTDVVERLTEGGNEAQTVIDQLEKLRSILTNTSNMTIHMAVNLEEMSKIYPDLAAPWSNITPENFNSIKKKLNVIPDWKDLDLSQRNPSCVTGLGSVESNFLVHTCPGINDFNDPDLAMLLVYFQYITQLEGPMWKRIRGQGFAYSYKIVPRPHESLVYLILYKATNVVAAFKEAKDIIEARIKNTDPWDQTLFESAKSSLIYEIINREKTIGDVVSQSLLSYFKCVPHDYNRKLVRQIDKVEISDMDRISEKYVSKLFDSSMCKTSVVCHPSKVHETTMALNNRDIVEFAEQVCVQGCNDIVNSTM